MVRPEIQLGSAAQRQAYSTGPLEAGSVTGVSSRGGNTQRPLKAAQEVAERLQMALRVTGREKGSMEVKGALFSLEET